MRTFAFGLALSLFLWAAAPAGAQQGTSSIGGKVTDQGGGVLPGVAITLVNEDTGLTRDLITGAEGSYLASQITPGRYRVTAKLAGFKTLERRNIVLEVGHTTPLDFTLEVGQLADTVTVSADLVTVNTANGSTSSVITSTSLINLPSSRSLTRLQRTPIAQP